jgi:hypothetical protein
MTDDQPLWIPTSQVNNPVYDPQRGMVAGKRIHFVISDGTNDYVDIPLSELTPETAEAMIHEAAMRHVHVMALTGPTLAQLPSYQPPKRTR